MTDSPLPIQGASLPPVGRVDGAAAESAQPASGASFQDVLRDSIANVNRLQTDAETAIQQMETGKNDSVSEVMTAVEKADLAFKMLMQVRNKLVDAYEELMQLRI